MNKKYKVERFGIFLMIVIFLLTITACDFGFPKNVKVNNVIGVWGFTRDNQSYGYPDVRAAGVNLVVIGLRVGLHGFHGLGLIGTNFYKSWQQPIGLPFIHIDILPFWNPGYGLELFFFSIGI